MHRYAAQRSGEGAGGEVLSAINPLTAPSHPQPPCTATALRPSSPPGVHPPTPVLIYAGSVLVCRARYRLSATLSSCPDFCPVVRPVSPSRSVRIFIFRPAVQSFTGSLTAPHPPLSRMERGPRLWQFERAGCQKDSRNWGGNNGWRGWKRLRSGGSKDRVAQRP